jgi:hypothetical protein
VNKKHLPERRAAGLKMKKMYMLISAIFKHGIQIGMGGTTALNTILDKWSEFIFTRAPEPGAPKSRAVRYLVLVRCDLIPTYILAIAQLYSNEVKSYSL